jgi:hypothetical protein
MACAPRRNIKDKLGSINCVKPSFAREQRSDSLFNIYHFTTLTRRLLHFSGLSRRARIYFYFFFLTLTADDNSTMNPHLITLKFSLSRPGVVCHLPSENYWASDGLAISYTQE